MTLIDDRKTPPDQRLENVRKQYDLGLSASKKQNFPTLRGIIEGAKSGKIPQGAVMIVESLDRVSRAEVLEKDDEDGTLDIFKKILQSGVEVFDTTTGQLYTKESLKNPMSLMMMIMGFCAATEYTAKLSNRVR